MLEDYNCNMTGDPKGTETLPCPDLDERPRRLVKNVSCIPRVCAAGAVSQKVTAETTAVNQHLQSPAQYRERFLLPAGRRPLVNHRSASEPTPVSGLLASALLPCSLSERRRSYVLGARRSTWYKYVAVAASPSHRAASFQDGAGECSCWCRE